MSLNLALRLGAITPSASFDPTSISGLMFWVDASDASTFTYSSGVVVSQWNDKSGNSRHLTQGTTANQPSRSGTQNGLSTVVFDGSNDVMSTGNITQAQPVTIFVVCKYDNADTNGRQVVGNAGATPTVYTTSGRWHLFAAAPLDSGVTDDSSWHLFTALFNGASSTLRLDRSQIVAGTPGGAGYSALPIIIGGDAGSSRWDGDVAEVLIYNSALGTTDRDNVESYLRTKWGTA